MLDEAWEHSDSHKEMNTDAFGRFYLGLIDCITLIEGPELKSYLRTLLQAKLPADLR